MQRFQKRAQWEGCSEKFKFGFSMKKQKGGFFCACVSSCIVFRSHFVQKLFVFLLSKHFLFAFFFFLKLCLCARLCVCRPDLCTIWSFSTKKKYRLFIFYSFQRKKNSLQNKVDPSFLP